MTTARLGPSTRTGPRIGPHVIIDARSRRLRDRFEARAIDKAGELLRQIAPAHGANQNIKGDAPLKVTHEKAACDARPFARSAHTVLSPLEKQF
jgi:hypothetical protein